MAPTAARMRAITVVCFLALIVSWPAAAQITPAPPTLISSPGVSSQNPMITFHPATGQFAIAYREGFPRRWVGAFLDQDGNRVLGPYPVLNDSPYNPSLRDVLPFPFSTSILSTFEIYGHPSSFGNNVFIGDAGGVGWGTNGVTSGIVNYTNTGGDSSVANNCGEHEEMGVSAVDGPRNLFFTSYTQNFHAHTSGGSCITTGTNLMAGYHQNQLPFNGFNNGPFLIESGAGSQDAVYNPGTTHVWFGYASAQLGRLRIAQVTPSGVAQYIDVTPGDGVTRFGLKFAVHPTTNNVLAIWQVRDANFNITLMGRLYDQNGVAIGSDVVLSNPATENIQRAWVAATADSFFIAAYVFNATTNESHAFGLLLEPDAAIASPWTRLDFITDAFGQPQKVNFSVDLVANPIRGTYAVVVDTFSDSYFIEVTAATAPPVQFPLTVTTSGDGVVTSAPAGINCGAACSADFDEDSVVQLTATPAAGWRFGGWAGGSCSGTGTCSVTITGATAVTATFVQQFTLTVSTSGSGGGLVSSVPAGMDCPGASCSIAVDGGSSISLAAAADATSRFAGWSGACSGPACSVVINSDTVVTATFVRQFDVQAAIGGGDGTIVSTPAGINCAGDCSERFDTGTSVTLTATPAAGSRFIQWNGCPGNPFVSSCTVSAADYEQIVLTATFVQQFTVNVVVQGNGIGTVTAPGISCPGDCTETYDFGIIVGFTATPGPSSTFTGWGGGCNGVGIGQCLATDSVTITANFIRPTMTLGVALGGTGSGVVTSNPAGINCGAECAAAFPVDTVVTLTATPAAGSTFTGWGGYCLGTGPCVVPLGLSQSVTATFTAAPSGPTIAAVSAQISALAPVIGNPLARTLTRQLALAQTLIARGNRRAAQVELAVVAIELRVLVLTRRLPAATGNALIADLRAIIDSL